MALNSMYENLMGLPLFNGVSYNRISEIVGSTRLAFSKYLPGEKILDAGDPCTRMMFVIGGSVRLTVRNSTDRFVVTQTLEAPTVVSPDYLFGRNTLYPATVTAIDTVSIMQIDKNDFISIIRSDEVCLFNYLNYISTNAQKAIDGVLALTSGSLEERIAFWIIALTQRDGKDITLSCRQRDLYTLFGVQRSSFISTLDGMKERGLIDYTSTEIRVLSRTDLRSVLLKSPD
ncbi:MAG: Crp/Fnr family transcriptional regulator [Duncaniella sp.]|uniref:Crp/Fnr family transcriptional regulator n=1 Tax=Duncaniella sp. TaxID=2518496 RepID=UPI0019A914B1|nr:Crp/Fnr family transcriptional regulator [Duncaniella sp.]MBD5313113.1 Crp/Fnr family transcriptional regulator [Bacteroides sp.]MDE6090037.1 Crp/Fnr family transcriptional regulator [Duncaniella sp.]